ncbi:MAG: hypothetical protein MI923_18475 [Phycisphaerales bacterium]|nr:hypothetical protein [Phycisphaerales bacterium]
MQRCSHATVKLLFVFGMTSLLSGCSSMLVGNWKSDKIPEDASFYIRAVEFKDDGTYTGSAMKKGGDPRRIAGKYEFDGFSLKLMQVGRNDRVYSAFYNSFMNTLDITKDGQKQTLKKQ